MKFTTKGSITLNCFLKDHHIYFEVIDTGIGISKENIVDIFDKFKQVSTSTIQNIKEQVLV